MQHKIRHPLTGFGGFMRSFKWWRRRESNPRPAACLEEAAPCAVVVCISPRTPRRQAVRNQSKFDLDVFPALTDLQDVQPITSHGSRIGVEDHGRRLNVRQREHKYARQLLV